MVTGKYYIALTNNLMPRANYYFDSQGRMTDKAGNLIVPEKPDVPVVPDEPDVPDVPDVPGGDSTKKNGIVKEDGALYYYVDDVRTYAGLMAYNGYYYYVNSSCKVVTGKYYISLTNDLMPRAIYYFDSQGRMTDEAGNLISAGGETNQKNGIVREGSTMYYYVNGVRTYAGLIKIDGYYYYVNSSCKVVTGEYYISLTNDLMPRGYYNFDSQGRMILN